MQIYVLYDYMPKNGKRFFRNKKRVKLVTFYSLLMSGYQDSNLGPPAPKAGALTGLRYTPKLFSEKRCKDRGYFLIHKTFFDFF